MVIQKLLLRTLSVGCQILAITSAVIPTLSYATTINILSEELVVDLQALNETYVYSGSGFTAPDWNAIQAETLLPNYNPYEPAPSSFSSMFWWNAFQDDVGFRFFGDANTDRSIRGGDYNPETNVYASSTVSFNMVFTVEGDGASLRAAIVTGSILNSAITLLDLTADTSFSGGELLSGHKYYLEAWSKSVNGSGNENAFQIDFLSAQANIAEPFTILLMAAGLAGLGFACRKMESK